MPLAFETRSPPTLARCYPRSFTFYVTRPHALHSSAVAAAEPALSLPNGSAANCFASRGLDRNQVTSSPAGICPGSRNVFTNSPSPHTIISGNRLNHIPSLHFRLGNEPVSEMSQLSKRNLPFRNSIEEMIQQCRWNVLPPDLRHVVADRRNRG